MPRAIELFDSVQSPEVSGVIPEEQIWYAVIEDETAALRGLQAKLEEALGREMHYRPKDQPKGTNVTFVEGPSAVRTTKGE